MNDEGKLIIAVIVAIVLTILAIWWTITQWKE